MVAVRLVPIAPFTVVNMVAGASHVELRDFVAGTAIGLLPGIIALSVVADSAATALTDPEAGSWAVFLGVALFFGVVLVWLRRRFGKLGGTADG